MGKGWSTSVCKLIVGTALCVGCYHPVPEVAETVNAQAAEHIEEVSTALSAQEPIDISASSPQGDWRYQVHSNGQGDLQFSFQIFVQKMMCTWLQEVIKKKL